MAKRTAPPAGGPTLGDAIREVIRRRGLSLYAVARAAGLDRSSVSRWHSRERGIAGEGLEAIAAALGLRLAEGRGGLR